MLIFRRCIFSVIIVIIAGIFLGCSEDLFTGEMAENKPPIVRLTHVPMERAITSYKIHFYWDSYDPDGEVDYCEYIIVSGDPYGFSPADTMVEWQKAISYSANDSTEAVNFNDKVFNFECDSVSAPWEGNTEDIRHTRFEKTNTFFIRAIDLDGLVSKVEYVSFTSWTLAPTCEITQPIGSSRNYSTVITFGWRAKDYIDSHENIQFPESIRYLCKSLIDIIDIYPEGQKPTLHNLVYAIADSMNSCPKRFYPLWGDWRGYSSSGSGAGEKYGDALDEELLPSSGSYLFALQAKDEAGAVTSIMKSDDLGPGNVRIFSVTGGLTPTLTISEKTIGSSLFSGAGCKAKQVDIPPGVELNFTWRANAVDYGGKIVGYRYGWDIVNTENPEEWAVSNFGLDYNSCIKVWTTGSHTLYVEAKDDGGHISRGLIRVYVVRFGMERDLILIDDWMSYRGTAEIWDGLMPMEDEHDLFLADICKNNLGSNFNDAVYPAGDVYNYSELGDITISDISNYKNMIWIYGANVLASGWKKNLIFIAESEASGGTSTDLNLIRLFLRAGGHVLSYGYTGRSCGGLVDCFDSADLTRSEQGGQQRFPLSIPDDLILQSGDNSYETCMAYDDYGVTVLDRIRYCDQEDFAVNSMKMVIVDNNDPVTSMYPGLPDTINLLEEITTNGMFWDEGFWGSSRCGLWFVEAFDGPRHMEEKGVSRHLDWFHPMYRMKACSGLSSFEDAPVALILTRNANRLSYSGTGIAANSFHFGFPLWYLEHEAVEKIFEIIFTEWQIKQ